MSIVRARECDADSIISLLYEVHDVHAKGRPDLFKAGEKKYSRAELVDIINDEKRPIFLYEDDNGNVLGHAFLIIKESPNASHIPHRTLYIDDICVSSTARHQGICSKMLTFVEEYAKSTHCYNITLNVFAFNETAIECYKKFGMEVRALTLEKIVK